MDSIDLFNFWEFRRIKFFDLLLDFKEFIGEDLYEHLQDTSNHILVTEEHYMQITGNRQLPKGYGGTVLDLANVEKRKGKISIKFHSRLKILFGGRLKEMIHGRIRHKIHLPMSMLC